jgi:hypothetical protein
LEGLAESGRGFPLGAINKEIIIQENGTESGRVIWVVVHKENRNRPDLQGKMALRLACGTTHSEFGTTWKHLETDEVCLPLMSFVA